MDRLGGQTAAQIISKDTILRCRRPIFLLLTVLVLSLVFPDFAYEIFITGRIVAVGAWLGVAALFYDLYEKAQYSTQEGRDPRDKGQTAAPMTFIDMFVRWSWPAFVLFALVVLSVQFPDKVYGVLTDRQIAPVAWSLLALTFGDPLYATWKDKRAAAQAVPDPKKWHFDRNSGEYFRITGHHKGHVIYNTTTYSQRVLQDHSDSKSARECVIGSIISGCITLFFLSQVIRGFRTPPGPHHEATVNPYLFLIGLFAAPLGGAYFIGMMWGALAYYTKADVGPPPVAPRGLEEVEEQKAYGDASPADIAAIHNALSGNAALASSAVAGSRRRLFDE